MGSRSPFPLLAPLLLTACPVDSAAPVAIPGSASCLMPEGYEASDPGMVSTAADDADAFFADDALPLFELWFPDGAWEQLCDNAQAYADYLWEKDQGLDPVRQRHEYAEARMVFQGQRYDPVGVRYRGRTTLYALFYDGEDPRPDALQRCYDRQLADKPSVKISLDEFGLDDAIADQQTFNLIAQEGSDSLYLREVLAQRLVRQFGLVAPRANHGRLCIDGAYEGVYSLVEEADTRRFRRQHWVGADSGGYYKIESDGEQTWHDSWDTTGDWIYDYEPVGDTSTSDPGALEELLRAGSLVEAGAAEAEIEAALEGLVDVDQWLQQIAQDMVIPDYDGMFGNHKNHLLYAHPERGFVVVPYDRDQAFVDLDEYSGGQCRGDIMGGHPCWSSTTAPPMVAGWLVEQHSEDYRAAVREFADEVMVPEEVIAWVQARAAAIRPWLEADRYYRPDSPACIDDPDDCGYYTMEAWEWRVDPYFTGVIEGRWEEVQRQLDGGEPCEEPCDED